MTSQLQDARTVASDLILDSHAAVRHTILCYTVNGVSGSSQSDSRGEDSLSAQLRQSVAVKNKKQQQCGMPLTFSTAHHPILIYPAIL
jgi:hypothetical protein